MIGRKYHPLKVACVAFGVAALSEWRYGQDPAVLPTVLPIVATAAFVIAFRWRFRPRRDDAAPASQEPPPGVTPAEAVLFLWRGRPLPQSYGHRGIADSETMFFGTQLDLVRRGHLGLAPGARSGWKALEEAAGELLSEYERAVRDEVVMKQYDVDPGNIAWKSRAEPMLRRNMVAKGWVTSHNPRQPVVNALAVLVLPAAALALYMGSFTGVVAVIVCVAVAMSECWHPPLTTEGDRIALAVRAYRTRLGSAARERLESEAQMGHLTPELCFAVAFGLISEQKILDAMMVHQGPTSPA